MGPVPCAEHFIALGWIGVDQEASPAVVPVSALLLEAPFFDVAPAVVPLRELLPVLRPPEAEVPPFCWLEPCWPVVC